MISMVDLDTERPHSIADEEEDTYDIIEEFILKNLLLFSLRKGFLKAAHSVLLLFHQFSYHVPPLAQWCLIATRDPPTKSSQSILQAQISWLDSLIAITQSFIQSMDQPSCSFREPMVNYLTKARRSIIHLHLEAFSESGDMAVFLQELNRHFPADSTDPVTRQYRLKFAQLLMSKTRTQRYLDERWLPHRSSTLSDLTDLAWKVAQQFPDVLLDKIGTSEWSDVDVILRHLNTAMSLCLREYFRDRSECTEQDILEFAHFADTQSLPSQLF